MVRRSFPDHSVVLSYRRRLSKRTVDCSVRLTTQWLSCPCSPPSFPIALQTVSHTILDFCLNVIRILSIFKDFAPEKY